jgi:hypothetical protein
MMPAMLCRKFQEDDGQFEGLTPASVKNYVSSQICRSPNGGAFEGRSLKVDNFW